MPTGDGLLVRLLPAGTDPLDAFGKLCAAARRHGNGIIEITARGSIQVRGLSARFGAALCRRYRRARHRGGRRHSGSRAMRSPGSIPQEILDAGALAADLRRALAERSLSQSSRRKSPSSIDGGGALDLDDLAADVRLCAEATHSGVALAHQRRRRWRKRDGARRGRAERRHRNGPAIARSHRTTRPRRAGARCCCRERELHAFRAAIIDFLIIRPALRANGAQIRRRHDRHAIGCATERCLRHRSRFRPCRRSCARTTWPMPRGRSAQPAYAPAPERAAYADRLHATRAASSFAASPNVSALSSAPTIRAGMSSPAPARRSARRRTSPPAPWRRASPRSPRRISAPTFDIHISGCAKGCAHAEPAALTVVGTPDGCALIADGSARDAPFRHCRDG